MEVEAMNFMDDDDVRRRVSKIIQPLSSTILIPRQTN